ncbi:MAG: hypothetical protein R3E01_33160 [Pirellulaceae bacterium]|nr:hypothetical protein [Planctomycetales bacterium]
MILEEFVAIMPQNMPLKIPVCLSRAAWEKYIGPYPKKPGLWSPGGKRERVRVILDLILGKTCLLGSNPGELRIPSENGEEAIELVLTPQGEGEDLRYFVTLPSEANGVG